MRRSRRQVYSFCGTRQGFSSVSMGSSCNALYQKMSDTTKNNNTFLKSEKNGERVHNVLKGRILISFSTKIALFSVSKSPIGPKILTMCPLGSLESQSHPSILTTNRLPIRNDLCLVFLVSKRCQLTNKVFHPFFILIII